MGCSCRGGRRAGSTTRNNTKVLGFDYVPPDGGDPIRFLTSLEAKREQRRRGGGTIYQVTEKQ
ncbi:hypothetical protein [Mycolicibacterium sp.]|uniref:DUF7196 family protein n=1 Tax=Mycolicibacterium sp. TaxID=2320850 RepID=UPI00355E02A2